MKVTKTLQKNSIYSIKMAGTADEERCGYPVCGYRFLEPGLHVQPNVMVRIENRGESDIVNPRLIVNGRRRFYSLRAMVADVVKEFYTVAEKSKAIFWWHIGQRVHASNRHIENYHALTVYNSLGYMLCGNNSYVLHKLWRQACFPKKKDYYIPGSKPTLGSWRGTDLGAHYTSEYYYDGTWKMLDGEVAVYYLKRDNKSIASREELARDHDLVRLAHTGTLTFEDSPQTRERIAGLYCHKPYGVHPALKNIPGTWEFTLRPGESIEYRWDNRGLHDLGYPLPKVMLDMVTGNGYWEYKPDLTQPASRRACEKRVNLLWPGKHGQTLRAANSHKPWKGIWVFHCPYYFLGARLKLNLVGGHNCKLTVECCFNKRKWLKAVVVASKGVKIVSFDGFSGIRQHCHDIRIRLTGTDGVEVKGLEFEADIQLSLKSLPMLTVGNNKVEYFDQTRAKKKVQIIHEFREIDRGRPPHPPQKPIFPKNGESVKGLVFEFRWPEAYDPQGNRIRDYHFQLSEDPKFRWPLSSNFDRLSTLVQPFDNLNAFTMPGPGLINPGKRYYWRIRAMNRRGMWSKWSKIWSFVAIAPGVVEHLAVSIDGKTDQLVLSWKPPKIGSKPVKYEIHGSDEQGFMASHKPRKCLIYWCKKVGKKVLSSQIYQVTPKMKSGIVGGSNEKGMSCWGTIPATFLCETERCEYRVSSGEKWYAFYRIVAVDANGSVGGASDFSETPRPFIHMPQKIETQGRTINLFVQTVRSKGHLVSSQIGGKRYFIGEADDLKFTLKKGSSWLKLNARTGHIKGSAPRQGHYKIKVEVINQYGKCHGRTFTLVPTKTF